MSRVVIVGGGVIGLASAYELARAGSEVTVLERGEIGRGCSEGNAGWVTPAISLPIAAPGLRSKGLRWFLQPDSPLYVRPSALPRLAPWLWQFFKLCSTQAFERAASVMMPFASDAVELYEQWVEDTEGIEWQQKGLLMAFRTEAALEDELALLEANGYGPIATLDAAALHRREPALSDDRYIGGIHVATEAHVEPLTVTRSLANRCLELGVTIMDRYRVDQLCLDAQSGKARAVRGKHDGTEPTDIEADHFVIATGAEAGRLSAACGTRIPLQAGKGYSVTIQDPEIPIAHPLYLAEAKVGISPFEGALRVAGTLELSGINTRLDRTRLAGFERAAEREIPGITRGGERREWVGMRPMTPDGMPIIGRLPSAQNVWLNTAHQMLGITLAPRSGRLLKQLLLGEEGEGEGEGEEADSRFASAFAPSRFN